MKIRYLFLALIIISLLGCATSQNYRYSYSGDKLLTLLKVFDDGKFTYFKFNLDSYQELPTIYSVDINHHETLLNYHRQDDFVVINTLAREFILRMGSYVTHIYNNIFMSDRDYFRRYIICL